MKCEFKVEHKLQPKDSRDWKFTSTGLIEKEIDLRIWASRIKNQGVLNSCSAFAICAALEIDANKDRSIQFDYSEMFIWYFSRAEEDKIEYNTGVYLRDAIKVMKNIGVSYEFLWPYAQSKYLEKPSWTSRFAARFTRPVKDGFYSIPHKTNNTVMLLKEALSAKKPIIFGMMLYPQFKTLMNDRSGIVSMPKPREKALGGHAMCIVGYKKINNKTYFIVRNSWDYKFGNAGYCYVSEEYMKLYGFDYWIIN